MWAFGNIASGAAAGGLSLTVTYPLEYARTRLSNDSKGTGKAAKQYNGILDVWKKTLTYDGVAGIYRGLCSLVSTINNLKNPSWCHCVSWALLWTL
jgi:hypothetical protein